MSRTNSMSRTKKKKRDKGKSREHVRPRPITLKGESARVHLQLRGFFQSRGLELDDIWAPASDDLDQQNRHLALLRSYLVAYEECPDVEELKRRGYSYPPVSPGYGPDEDWGRFERWIQKKPLSWSYEEDFGPLPDESTLDDTSLSHELEKIFDNLASRNVSLDLVEGVPERVVYLFLKKALSEASFEIISADAVTIVGCPTFCPGCMLRPWCEQGQEPWNEEEAGGKLVFPDGVEPYLPPKSERSDGA